MREGWRLAKGTCGYNVKPPVYGAYVNGNALFAWQTAPDWFQGVITGHLTTGGPTLDAAMQSAEEWSRKCGVEGSDNRHTKKQFEAKLAGV